MSDLQQRLIDQSKYEECYPPEPGLYMEAAKRIEELEADNEKLRDYIENKLKHLLGFLATSKVAD